ncbi:MAG TPA: aldo/keto reductase [Bryobacteraceae bacterium]|nr:aldo/keto reductase [Bryobacteraceae bacterium]
MMRYRPLGRSGITASVVAHGTREIRGDADEPLSIRAIQASLDAGVNFIDTAPAYGLGLSERIVAKAIHGRRDRVILATKCGLVWHAARGTFFLDQNGTRLYRYLGGESIRSEVEGSLQRLDTDYIDLYQTHWQDPATPIEETMGALLALKQEGKIRAIGVSNCTLDELRRYRSIGQVDSVQVRYGLLDREPEQGYLPYCSRNNIAVLARSAPAGGMLASRMQPFAEKYGLTTGQLSTAWTIMQAGVSHVIVGARDAAQAIENAGAGSVFLSADDVARVVETLHAFADVSK